MARHLDSGVRDFLDRLALLNNKALGDLTPDEAREQHRKLVEFGQGTAPADDVFQVHDTVHGHVPLREYTMWTEAPDTVVVYLHGGGWVLGSIETADAGARAIARSLNCTVVSVGYRLAPEHRYPVAVDDCRAALEYVTSRYPHSRIAVAGDSAGANLALAMSSASLTSDTLRVDAQLLLYPALDPEQRGASHDEFADGYLLTKADMRWFWQAYVSDAPASAPYPAPDTVQLAGMPRTVITTAGFDPLQDEGTALAQQLVEANVPTTHISHDGLTHGWMDFAGTVPAAAHARASVLDVFARELAAVPAPTPAAAATPAER